MQQQVGKGRQPIKLKFNLPNSRSFVNTMAGQLEIVDAHMHLWTPETHPWTEKVKDGGHPAGKFGKIGFQIMLCSI